MYHSDQNLTTERRKVGDRAGQGMHSQVDSLLEECLRSDSFLLDWQ